MVAAKVEKAVAAALADRPAKLLTERKPGRTIRPGFSLFSVLQM